MKKLTIGIVAAAALLSAAPAFAIEVDVGPNGIRVGPRDRELGPRAGSMASGISVIDPIIAIVPIAGR